LEWPEERAEDKEIDKRMAILSRTSTVKTSEKYGEEHG
jgi:hypothetical protein